MPVPPPTHCSKCGVKLTPKQRVKDSSRKCGYRGDCRECNAKRGKERSAATRRRCDCGAERPPGKSRHCEACRQAKSVVKAQRNERACGTCGGPTSGASRFCSKACRPSTTRQYESRRYQRKTTVERVVRQCEHCGRLFQQPDRECAAKYCPGGGCARAASKLRRRARESGARVGPVNRARVFATHGWVCHLCGLAIPRRLSVPHDLAATLDHVVPLACGGEHSEANLRPAHFICNSTKGDRVEEAQAGAQGPHTPGGGLPSLATMPPYATPRRRFLPPPQKAVPTPGPRR